uniref:Uncharacterized protein n=1 Tax=Arundo donax TaxID=35708 RepID=A0A0A9GTZ9_ARUDO
MHRARDGIDKLTDSLGGEFHWVLIARVLPLHRRTGSPHLHAAPHCAGLENENQSLTMNPLAPQRANESKITAATTHPAKRDPRTRSRHHHGGGPTRCARRWATGTIAGKRARTPERSPCLWWR